MYALQLSLYQYILERVYGLLVREEDKALIVVGEVLESVPEDTLVGDGEGMQEVRRLIGKVASAPATVLIHGERGPARNLWRRQFTRVVTVHRAHLWW